MNVRSVDINCESSLRRKCGGVNPPSYLPAQRFCGAAYAAKAKADCAGARRTLLQARKSAPGARKANGCVGFGDVDAFDFQHDFCGFAQLGVGPVCDEFAVVAAEEFFTSQLGGSASNGKSKYPNTAFDW